MYMDSDGGTASLLAETFKSLSHAESKLVVVKTARNDHQGDVRPAQPRAACSARLCLSAYQCSYHGALTSCRNVCTHCHRSHRYQCARARTICTLSIDCTIHAQFNACPCIQVKSPTFSSTVSTVLAALGSQYQGVVANPLDTLQPRFLSRNDARHTHVDDSCQMPPSTASYVEFHGAYHRQELLTASKWA